MQRVVQLRCFLCLCQDLVLVHFLLALSNNCYSSKARWISCNKSHPNSPWVSLSISRLKWWRFLLKFIGRYISTVAHCWILWWHQDKGWNFRTQTSSCGVVFHGRKWLDRFFSSGKCSVSGELISRSTINTWPPEHRKKAGVSTSSPWFT